MRGHERGLLESCTLVVALRDRRRLNQTEQATRMRDAQDLPHVAVTIHENEILAGAAKVLAYIRPDWKQENISYKVMFEVHN